MGLKLDKGEEVSMGLKLDKGEEVSMGLKPIAVAHRVTGIVQELQPNVKKTFFITICGITCVCVA